MTIDQAIYSAFSTAWKLTAAQLFGIVYLEFLRYNSFVEGLSKLVVVEEGR